MIFDLKKYLLQFYDEKICNQIENSFNEKKVVCIFLNHLKSDSLSFEKELQERNIEFLKLNEWIYFVKSFQKSLITSLELYQESAFYIQDFSSILASFALDVKTYESVLDMCAAPGGKSVNLANFMQNKAYLACVEKNKTRFFTLKKMLVNYGVKANCFCKDALSVGRLCEDRFDKILLDAPCSSYAKMGFSLQKSTKELKDISKLQKKLLHSALKALKIGGELVYSTCTFLKEENEEIIENALNSDFKLEILPLNFDFDFSSLSKFLNLNLFSLNKSEVFSDNEALRKNALRLLPSAINSAFFITKLKKL